MLLALLPAAAQAQEATLLPPDKPVTVAGVEAVCTGIGSDARENPLWASYPLKVEVAGQGGHYLGDVHVTVSQERKTVAAVKCSGPWILFRVPAGRYRVEGLTEGLTASSSALVFEKGQSRIILRFPSTDGQTSVPETPHGRQDGPAQK